jgi:hypothetical protein
LIIFILQKTLPFGMGLAIGIWACGLVRQPVVAAEQAALMDDERNGGPDEEAYHEENYRLELHVAR